MSGPRLSRTALVLLTSAVAAVTFVISFHGLNLFGRDVMRLSGLSPLVPAGVDLAALVALLASHLRRGESLGRRAYAWAVFAVTAALSVAGNLADGMARGLPAAGLVGVAAAPVVFVLVSHLAITSWRGGQLIADRTGLPDEPITDPDVLTSVLTPEPPKPSPAAVKIAKARKRYPTASQDQIAKRTDLAVRTVGRLWPATEPAPRPAKNGHQQITVREMPAEEWPALATEGITP